MALLGRTSVGSRAAANGFVADVGLTAVGQKVTVLTVTSAFEPLLSVHTAGHPCDAAGARPFSCSGGAAAVWTFNWTGFEVIQASISPV